MKVSLINYTGQHTADPSQTAADLLIFIKNTRLEMSADGLAKVQAWPAQRKAEELDYIANTLRSSWEFVDYTFTINGVTRAFTHQFVRTRTGSYAQQAQRVVNMGAFETLMPPSVVGDGDKERIWNNVVDTIQRGYQALSGLGSPAQDCRGLLPTNVLTNIVAKFNLRTLADLVAKRQNARAQGEYQDVAMAMAKEVLAVHPWAHTFLYPDRLATPELDAMMKAALGLSSPVDMPKVNAALKEIDKIKATWG